MNTLERTAERRKPRFRSDNTDLASEVNHELARLINDACRELDPDDRDQLQLYWKVHDELFAILDTVYLLMVDEGVTMAQGKVIAAALRIHIRACMARWRDRLDDFRAKQAHLRETLAEIDADVRALMGDEEYPDDDEPDNTASTSLAPEPEPPPPARTRDARARAGDAKPAKPGTVKVRNSFFKRVR